MFHFVLLISSIWKITLQSGVTYRLTTTHVGNSANYSNISQVQCLENCSKNPGKCCGFSFTLAPPKMCRNFFDCSDTGSYSRTEPFYLRVDDDTSNATHLLNPATNSINDVSQYQSFSNSPTTTRKLTGSTKTETATTYKSVSITGKIGTSTVVELTTNVETSTTIVPSTTTRKPCESGWILGGSLCYRALSVESLSFDETISKCPENSVAAPILNDEQNEAVIQAIIDLQKTTNFKNTHWAGFYIGLRDPTPKVEPPNFTWNYDGSPLGSYDKWLPTEPTRGAESCVGVLINQSYQWNDYVCDSKSIIGIVCAKNATI